ncbi:MAG: transglycosylase SLT domain-containing protein [Sulfurimonas sp.]|nr:transglycosylase SLT domain-containing protein [Sulfurimonas sp.]
MKKISIFLLFSLTLFAQSASDFKKQQMTDFQKNQLEFMLYKESKESKFESYKKAQNKVYAEYKKSILKYWDDPKISTQMSWVSYTEDKTTRTDVNFEKEIITLQTIASSKYNAKIKLQNALKIVITIDTKKAYNNDILEQNLEKIKKPSNIVISEINSEPILSTIIFDNTPTKASLENYLNKHVKKDNIKFKKSKKIKNKNVYTLNIKMPKGSVIKRSKIYYDEVKQQSKRQNIPKSLVFAIMHSESSFNPMARSHVPAYGLMQIVPRTAGIDSYIHLYNKKRVVSASYLYNTKNNITMGSAYLHILYYKYLKNIKDPQSRLYCTIAAYNTGAGNVAWAFVGTNNIKKASILINTMSSDQVYKKLQKDLKYNEPKRYLKKVLKRVDIYYKLYS